MELKDLQLYKENNKYYLAAKIFYEDRNGFYEMHVPKIALPINDNFEINLTSGYDDYYKPYQELDIDFGFGKLYAMPVNGQDTMVYITCIEEKVHEMTLAEIEKALGYKIKLKEET